MNKHFVENLINLGAVLMSTVQYSIKSKTDLKVGKGRLRPVLLFPGRVSPECLFDAPVVRDVLPLRVETVQVDPHLPHPEVTVLVCRKI